MTRPQDVQDIYNAIPVPEKSLYWIEGTDRRFDGYNFFGVHPELPIEWFDKQITDDNRFAKARSTSSPAAARLSACRNLRQDIAGEHYFYRSGYLLLPLGIEVEQHAALCRLRHVP